MQENTRSRVLSSASVQMSIVLMVVYLVFGLLGGDLLRLNIQFAWPFVQINELVWMGWVWMLFTSMFLHANPLHLLSNLFFLLLFGVSLEEQVSKRRWWAVYFASGLAGNLAFLFLGPFFDQDFGVGASGAIYGLLGAAGGLRATFLVILVAGLDIFAGGSLAHLGGLAMGLVLRRWGDRLSRILMGSPGQQTPI